jgi:hypothetical protein
LERRLTGLSSGAIMATSKPEDKLYRDLLREVIPLILFVLAAVQKKDKRKILSLLQRIQAALGD